VKLSHHCHATAIIWYVCKSHQELGKCRTAGAYSRRTISLGQKEEDSRGLMMSGHTCKAGIDIRHARVNLEL